MMYIGSAGVGRVVEWFNEQARENMLCLLVARTPQDAVLLDSLYANRERISDDLGKSLALFLFTGQDVEPEQSVWLSDDTLSTYLIVPGLEKASAGTTYRGNLARSWKPMPVNMYQNLDRDALVQRSQGMAGELCEYFQLARTETPCIILLTRNNPEPFVVRTRGMANLKGFEKFLSEVGGISKILRKQGLLDLPIAFAEAMALIDSRDEDRVKIQEERRLLSEVIPRTVEALMAAGCGDALKDVDPENAYQVFELLGLGRDPRARRPLTPVLRADIQEAMLDERIHGLIRQIKNSGVRLRKYSHRARELTEEIERRSNGVLLNPSLLAAEMTTIESRLDEICRQFESRFRWRRIGLPVREFVRLVTGSAKFAKDAASIVENADRIAQRMGPH
jgi:hypothetical protein